MWHFNFFLGPTSNNYVTNHEVFAKTMWWITFVCDATVNSKLCSVQMYQKPHYFFSIPPKCLAHVKKYLIWITFFWSAQFCRYKSNDQTPTQQSITYTEVQAYLRKYSYFYILHKRSMSGRKSATTPYRHIGFCTDLLGLWKRLLRSCCCTRRA